MSATLNLTLSLIVFGGELAGHALRAILARTTKTGRIDRALMRLAAAKAISMETDTPVDGRIIRLTDEGRRSALGGVDPAAAWARRTSSPPR